MGFGVDMAVGIGVLVAFGLGVNVTTGVFETDGSVEDKGWVVGIGVAWIFSWVLFPPTTAPKIPRTNKTPMIINIILDIFNIKLA